MRQIRLLPVVIAAGLALLLLKSLAIVSGGGYVLVGATEVAAAGDNGGGSKGEKSSGEDAMMAMPFEPTLMDEAPTIEDAAPMMSLTPETEAGSKDAKGNSKADSKAAPMEMTDGEGDKESQPMEPMPDDMEAASACPEGGESVLFSSADGCAPMTADGQAVPMVIGEAGIAEPIGDAEGRGTSEPALLERLAQRRQELDTRESELDMRLVLVDAAERRIAERTAALEALEARINALVEEKRTVEEAQFTALVSTYETMKPKDAAAIFDQLDMDVLLRVARALNPRKMAPIMAKMDPLKARDLTAGLAVDQVEPTIDMAGENLGALPQIVGQ